MSALARFFLSLPVAALFGWATAKVWGWFAVPLGLPAITLWQAWGLFLTAMIIRLWIINPDRIKDRSAEETKAYEKKAWAVLALKPVVLMAFVGIAFLVHKGGA